MGESFSGKNIIVKVVTIVLAIVLLLALSFYAIMDGIVSFIFEFLPGLAGAVGEGIWNWFNYVVLHEDYEGDLKVYKIGDSEVEKLKNELESKGIDTDVCGLTAIRLRKMLLAKAVSESFSQTLCMATITEEQMLENIKQKTQFAHITSISDFMANPHHEEETEDFWPQSNPYTLYYDSKKFFYFKDSENVFGGGPDQWYLGALGCISLLDRTDETDVGDLTVEGDGQMTYVDPTTFAELGRNFDISQESTYIDSDDDFATHQIMKIFTDGNGPNEVKVYNINTTEKVYDYTFENDTNGVSVEKYGADDAPQYSHDEQIVNLEESMDNSSFVVSMELMTNLLDMTSSGEFLETFIDYALNNLNVKMNLYRTTERQTTYSKKEYNIPDGFLIEVYDFVDVGINNATDVGDDNFKAYADIVYGRTYEGSPFESVAELLETNDIDYTIHSTGEDIVINADTIIAKIEEKIDELGVIGGLVKDWVGNQLRKLGSSYITDIVNAYIEGKEELLELIGSLVPDFLSDWADEIKEFIYGIIEGIMGDLEITLPEIEAAGGSLSNHLKTAYDPGSGFTLGNITVEEKLKTIKISTNAEAAMAKMQTWYGDYEYSEPSIKTEYFLSKDGEDETGITKDEYEHFLYSKLEKDDSAATSDEIKKIYTSGSIAEQFLDEYGRSMWEEENVEVISAFENGNDITDNVFNREAGYKNRGYYDAWTARGLFEIATKDKGEFNDNLGAAKGSDYVYLKYKRNNIQNYKEGTKIRRKALDTTTVQATVANSSIEEKLLGFLELLKNNTGQIPTSVGSEGGFNKDGQVVLYGDIYKGHIPAGDLLLDNGAEMLFELLQHGDPGLVNVFKYLAYLYTGIDYGVTDINQLVNIFEMFFVTGINNSNYWYPVGSEETTTVDGKIFATGEPMYSYTGSTGHFGYRIHPISGERRFHYGIDISGGNTSIPKGVVPIIASRSGRVENITINNGTEGYGNCIDIRHDDGFMTRYAHLHTDTITVRVGDVVEQGQVIAKMGTTGGSTGVHLHFEVRDPSGEAQDPFDYVSVEYPRPQPIATGSDYVIRGRNLTFYSLNQEWLDIFTAVIRHESGGEDRAVYWAASAMFNRIDVKYYGDYDAKKILTKGWSGTYNNGYHHQFLTTEYKNGTEFKRIKSIVLEVINGKRAHKYTNFGSNAPGNRVADNWISRNPGGKYEWEGGAYNKGNMFCDWRDDLQAYPVNTGGNFLQVAQKVWTEIVKANPVYSANGDRHPYLSDGDIDCSAYVSWVLYEYGYEEFKNQRNTTALINTNWNKKYGWTEIKLDRSHVGQKILNILRAGDILVKDGHTQIIAEIKGNGDVYVFDCGGACAWRKSTNGEPVKDLNTRYGGGYYNYPLPGKIIRVTPP